MQRLGVLWPIEGVGRCCKMALLLAVFYFGVIEGVGEVLGSAGGDFN